MAPTTQAPERGTSPGLIGAATTVAWGALPLGSLTAGVLLDHGGALPAVLVLSGGMVLTAAAATASRAVRRAPDLQRMTHEAGERVSSVH